MFITKKKYEALVDDVKLHKSALFGSIWTPGGVTLELRNKTDHKQLDDVKNQLLARIEEVEGLLIKAGLLVEVQEAESDLIREEIDLDYPWRPLGTKKVRYAVKKIK